MCPVDPVCLQHQHHRGAVRILFTGEAGQADDVVGIVDDAREQGLRGFGLRRKQLEILPGLDDHLLGSHRTATVAAHAIGQNRHHHPGPGWMREQADRILLLVTIPNMMCYAGLYIDRHGQQATVNCHIIAILSITRQTAA